MARTRRDARPADPTRHDTLLAALDARAGEIGMRGRAARPAAGLAPRRAGTRRAAPAAPPPAAPPPATIPLALVDDDGVLRWRHDTPATPATTKDTATGDGRRRASGRAAAPAAGRIVAVREFELLAADQVHAAIQRLDSSFTPARGLRRLARGRLVGCPPGPFAGRTLLVIHGTFSNADNVLEDLRATGHGRDLLARAERHYDRVLFFDHPTLAQGPLLNAVELNRLFAGSSHAVDVVCHSRGGLVARWWLETLAGGRRGPSRAVLVAAPIAGTSLAAGPRIRAGIDAMTNLGAAVAATGQVLGLAAPFLAAPVGLLRVLLSITGVAARVPIADAAMAAVPGLFAQSRIGNNSELALLRAGRTAGVDYFPVTADFEPDAAGWRFWRSFRRTTAADLAADVVFDGPNDLVVDTDSMGDFGTATGIRPAGRLDFGTTADIHHCGYFRDPRTSAFIARSLRIP